jgi:hypothetical protein
VNLVRPYTIIKEIWARSNPDDIDLQGAPLAHTMQQASQDVPMFGTWWAFWIANNIVGNISLRLSLRATTLEDNLTSFWIDIVSCTLSLIAAFLAIKVVRAITERQEKRFERLNANQPPVLDPPPITRSAAP